MPPSAAMAVAAGTRQRDNPGMTAPPARLPALRHALQDLHAGHYAAAAAASAPWANDPADIEAGLIYALAGAASGDIGAAPALARIARLRPDSNHPVQDLLDLLRRAGRAADALPHLRAAVAEMPDDPRLPALLGALLAEAGPMPEAIAAFQRAVALRPDAAGWSNLGKALAAQGRFAEADAAHAQALALAPSDAQLALNRAVALLKSGRLAEGWEALEYRYRLPGRTKPLPGPRAESLDAVAGRTVLLCQEEGLGDTLQMIRYAPLLAAHGARVLAWVPKTLMRLVAAVPGVSGVVPPGALPRFDLWCPMLSLPRLFGTTLERMPPAAPYLRADPADVARWAALLPHGGLRVGVAWAGGLHPNDPTAAATDRVRSMAPGFLAPLAEVPGIRLVSLQLGVAPPPELGMADPMPGVRDFADTAAVVANLDAVVSVDTSVLHLAAGMGKPVLLLDRYDACWRWLHGRTDSPWYPTLRICRQTSPGDWSSAVAAAASALEEMAAPPPPSGLGPRSGPRLG